MAEKNIYSSLEDKPSDEGLKLAVGFLGRVPKEVTSQISIEIKDKLPLVLDARIGTLAAKSGLGMDEAQRLAHLNISYPNSQEEGTWARDSIVDLRNETNPQFEGYKHALATVLKEFRDKDGNFMRDLFVEWASLEMLRVAYMPNEATRTSFGNLIFLVDQCGVTQTEGEFYKRLGTVVYHNIRNIFSDWSFDSQDRMDLNALVDDTQKIVDREINTGANSPFLQRRNNIGRDAGFLRYQAEVASGNTDANAYGVHIFDLGSVEDIKEIVNMAKRDAPS